MFNKIFCLIFALNWFFNVDVVRANITSGLCHVLTDIKSAPRPAPSREDLSRTALRFNLPQTEETYAEILSRIPPPNKISPHATQDSILASAALDTLNYYKLNPVERSAFLESWVPPVIKINQNLPELRAANSERVALREVLTAKPGSLADQFPAFPEQIAEMEKRYQGLSQEIWLNVKNGKTTATEMLRDLVRLQETMALEVEELEKIYATNPAAQSILRELADRTRTMFGRPTISKLVQEISSGKSPAEIGSKIINAFQRKINGFLGEIEVASFLGPPNRLVTGLSYSQLPNPPPIGNIEGEIDVVEKLAENSYKWNEIKAGSLDGLKPKAFESFLSQAKKQRAVIELQRAASETYQVAEQKLIIMGGVTQDVRERFLAEYSAWVSETYPQTASLTQFTLVAPTIP